MKTILFSLAACLGVMTMSHCTKSNDASKTDTLVQINKDTVFSYDTVYVVPKDSFPIIGLWIGSQVPEDGTSTDPLYFSLNLEEGGVIQSSGLGSDGNTYYSKGTYTLNGTAFSATMTVTRSYQAGLVQTLTATYHPENGTLTNGEMINVGTTYHGSFNLARVN